MPQRLEDYEVLGIVGSGSFGTCYKVCHKNTKQTYVWKAIDYGRLTEEKKQLLVSEVNLLSKLNHPNILQYFDRILHRETTTLYIITEWCQSGDLGALIKDSRKEGKLFDESFIWKALHQISKALQVCHTRLHQITLLHRDIKPANVFIDAKGNFKLGDFGLARSEEDCSYSDNIVGTPYYMSPEIIKGRKYDRKSDIWALGCLIYEMCALSPPFRGTTLQELMSNIRSGLYPPIPEIYSENMKKIVSFMLSVKKEFRPTVEMILHHPLVIMNIKPDHQIKLPSKLLHEEYHRKLKMEENVLFELSKGARNMSISQKEPEEISEALFKDRWLSRLESLREREAKLREREENVVLKEHSLHNKEKYLSLLEKKTKEKMHLAQVYLNRKKGKWTGSNENITDISADAGDSNIFPTTAKLNPDLLPKLNFTRGASSRRTVASKHVHFNTKALKENNGNTALPLLMEHKNRATLWSEQKHSGYQLSRQDAANKENMTFLKNVKVKHEVTQPAYPQLISKVYSPI